MKQLKTAEDFFNFFVAIPTHKWTTGEFKRGSKCCAFGHLGSNNGSTTPSAKNFGPLLNYRNVSVNDGMKIENYCNYRDLGKNPKERILNALVLKEAGLWEFATHLTGEPEGMK